MNTDNHKEASFTSSIRHQFINDCARVSVANEIKRTTLFFSRVSVRNRLAFAKSEFGDVLGTIAYHVDVAALPVKHAVRAASVFCIAQILVCVEFISHYQGSTFNEALLSMDTLPYAVNFLMFSTVMQFLLSLKRNWKVKDRFNEPTPLEWFASRTIKVNNVMPQPAIARGCSCCDSKKYGHNFSLTDNIANIATH